MGRRGLLRAANLGLLALLPLAWSAPLMRAGLLPLFDLEAISILSGLAALWQSDRALAALVALFALVAPVAKILGLELVLSGRLGGRGAARLLPVLSGLGRLAMADVFLVALYVVVAKGVGVGRLETGWGLWLFTALTLGALALSRLAKRP